MRLVASRSADIPVARVKGKARPRFGRGRAYQASSDRAWEQELLDGWKAANDGMFAIWAGEVHVTVTAYQPVPKSAPKRRDGEPWLSKPDADNILKSVMDALTGYAWHDDAQVTAAEVVKAPRMVGGEPHIEVQVEYIGGTDNGTDAR